VCFLRVPSFLLKKFMKVEINGDYIEFSIIKFEILKSNLLEELKGLIIKIDGTVIFDVDLFPNSFHIRLNGVFYNNHDLSKIYKENITTLDNFVLIIPNRSNIISGKHKISLGTKISNFVATWKFIIMPSQEKLEYPLIQTELPKNFLDDKYCPFCKKEITEENQKICEFCGSELIGKRV